MGLTYKFANLDKKEYFDPAIFGGNNKISGLLGDFLSGNAMARLLVGDWFQDRIAGVGDNATIEGYEQFLNYDKMTEEFADISSKVFAKMCEEQSEAVIEQAINYHEKQDSHLFLNVAWYYKSAEASEKFKQIFQAKLGENLENMIKEAEKPV